MVKHWIKKLAIDHGKLLLKYLKLAEKRTPKEVEMLEKLFSDFEVNLGDKVLDLCCGYGRHALRLAEKGYRVKGVDISPILIEHGRKLAKEMKIEDRIEFIVGDARNLLKLLEHERRSYRMVISMWASLGYYDDETDRSILRQSYELASTNGVLVLEMGNRDFLIKHFRPYGFNEFEDIELHGYPKLDLERSRLKNIWKFYKKEGDNLKHLTSIPLDMRIYSLHELIELIESAGWKFVKSYGTLEMQPVTSDINRIIAVGTKKM